MREQIAEETWQRALDTFSRKQAVAVIQETLEKVAQAAIDAAKECVVLDDGPGADDIRALSPKAIVEGVK